ncbi:sarcoplasmic calcium-binding protein-like isoform X2 [Ruditapes philippinarum]|nr:sarcoplasmic calcium-binding protein-like isoform X2 [Ruditapes philippinarum]
MADMMSEKWMIAFKLVDFNQDGVVNVKDRDDCIQSFLSVFQPGDGRKQKMTNQLNEFWDKIVFLTENPDWSKALTPDEFLATRKDAYTKDSTRTTTVVRDALKQLINAGNVDESGHFTYEEFKTLHEAFNLKEENLVKGIYSMIGPDANGKISVDNVADFYTELAMGNDEGKHAQYKTALASVGFV